MSRIRRFIHWYYTRQQRTYDLLRRHASFRIRIRHNNALREFELHHKIARASTAKESLPVASDSQVFW